MKKTISGFHCIEYLLVDPNSDNNITQKIWMAPDAEINWMEGLSSFGQSKSIFSANATMPANYPKGAVIEMVVEDKKGNPTSITTVEKLNMNTPKSILTSGYSFMNLGGMAPKD